MASLRGVQTGTVTVAGLEQSVTLSTTLLDANKSILFFTAYSDDASGDSKEYFSYGRIENTTTLRFGTNRTTASLYVRWTLYEFTSGVSVQHLYSATNASSFSISTIDTSNTWLIATYASTTSASTSRTWINCSARFYFGSTTSVTVDQVGTSIDHIAVQVITWTGATVQYISDTANSTTLTISSAVTLSKALLFVSDKPSNYAYNDGIPFWYISSTTQLTAIATYSNSTVSAFIVELPEASMQRGQSVATGGSTTKVVTITSVTSTTNTSVINYSAVGTLSRYENNQLQPGHYHSCRLTLDSTTQFTAQIGASPQWSFGVVWQVFELIPAIVRIPRNPAPCHDHCIV